MSGTSSPPSVVLAPGAPAVANGWAVDTGIGTTIAVPIDGTLPIWDRDQAPILPRADPGFLTALGDPQHMATGIPGTIAGGPVNSVWLSRAADSKAPDLRGPGHRRRTGS